MKQLLVLSGKGGTGKTSISACLAQLAQNSVIVDADVDAANLHLLLNPQIITDENFYSGFQANINAKNCTQCGLCKSLCRFGAISQNNKGEFIIDELLCEGCGVCADNCPTKSATLEDYNCGKLYTSQTQFGKMVHAELGAGGENSGKLVTAVRNRAKEIAEDINAQLIVIDGPPGIGCPVIASAGGCDYAVIVTEPTQSGLHDLKRVTKLMNHFSIATGVVINKADLNEQVSMEIENFCNQNSFRLLGKISYDKAFTSAQREAKTILEFSPNSKIANQIILIWDKIKFLVS